MSTYLKTIVAAYIGKDAEVHTYNGKNITNFNVCHTVKFKDSTGILKERSTWIARAAWGELGDKLLPYLKKGNLVLVEGEISTKVYTSKANVAESQLQLRADKVVLLASPKTQVGGNVSQPTPTNEAPFEVGDDGLPLPF